MVTCTGFADSSASRPAPPEQGLQGDYGRRPARYLGFLFASCVSDGFLWAVVRSTAIPRHLSSVDEFEAVVFGEVGVVLDIERGEWQLAGDAQAAIQESLTGRGRPRRRALRLDLASDRGGAEAGG